MVPVFKDISRLVIIPQLLQRWQPLSVINALHFLGNHEQSSDSAEFVALGLQ